MDFTNHAVIAALGLLFTFEVALLTEATDDLDDRRKAAAAVAAANLALSLAALALAQIAGR